MIASPSPLTIISDSRFLDHDTGMNHPELPVRLQTILLALKQNDIAANLEFQLSHPADRQWLLAAHDEGWLFRFEETVLSGKTSIDHPDNQIGYESYDIAVLAAGAGLKAIDLLEQGQAAQGLCLVRPPGHHAERGRPFGFCFLNNCVIAARYWQQRYGRQRTLVFDFDAHHGNGIQSAFERESDTLYISIHEHPSFSYPGTGFADESGLGEGRGSILNLPLSSGSGDEQFLALLNGAVVEKIAAWQPDAFIVAAGFDGHRADEMSGLCYSTELYEQIGRFVRTWSNRLCEGRLLSILEGGYELSVLGESVTAFVRGLLVK